MQQFQRNAAGTHQPDTRPFCHNLTRECQPGCKKSTNKSLLYYFVEPLHQRKGFLGLLMMKSFGSIVIALFGQHHILLEEYCGHYCSHGIVLNCKTIPRRGRTALSHCLKLTMEALCRVPLLLPSVSFPVPLTTRAN